MMKKEISTPKAVAMTIGGGQRSGESSTAASKRGWKRTGALLLAATTAVGAYGVGNVINDRLTEQDRVISQDTKQRVAEMDATLRQEDVQNYVVEHPGATEEQINAFVESDTDPHQPGIQTDK